MWVLEGASTMKEHKWSWLYMVGWGQPQSSPIACHLTRNVVNKHKSSNNNGVAEIREKRGGMLILSRRAFAYVETTEPLSVYPTN